MPIHVSCPSCGRVGQAPAEAVGRTVRCPGCFHEHILTTAMIVTGGSPARAEAPRRREPTRPPARDLVEEALIVRGARPAATRPPAPVPAGKGTPSSDGFHLTLPVLVGGLAGVVLVTALSVWAILSLSRGSEVVVADPSAAGQPATPAAPPEFAKSLARRDADEKPTPPRSASARTRATTDDATEPSATPVAESVALAESVDRARPPEPEPASTPAVDSATAGRATVAELEESLKKSLSTAEIVEESEPSVALVKGKNSSGTGFLVAPGLLATNSHVIDDEFIADLEIRFVSADEAHKGPLKAELLYEDAQRDLAFLAVKTNLKPLRVAKTYSFRKGEDITVIGSPGIGDGQVLENAISRGVMSTRTQIEGRSFYQLGIAINPGNSGGPVFDSLGRVIGVATLKSMKQESTGFSIPIEDVQLVIARVAQQSSAEANQAQSRHRLLVSVKGLGTSGAAMCMIIDLRRAAAANNPAAKEVLGKLEPVIAEFDKDLLPTIKAEEAQVRNDALVDPAVKRRVGDLATNLANIRSGYVGWRTVDDRQLRSWKQSHKQLYTQLASQFHIEVPAALLAAFDDRTPAQQAAVVTMNPQNLSSFGPRLRPQLPNGTPRAPSLRDRARGRTGR